MRGERQDQHVDVLIIGAGLSGIGAACYLKARCPTKSFAILEERDAIGGTWDLFRYPGIRSDSDMYTLGYSFRPWRSDKAMADGPLILRYLQDTATEHGIEGAIRFGHRERRLIARHSHPDVDTTDQESPLFVKLNGELATSVRNSHRSGAVDRGAPRRHGRDHRRLRLE